MELLRCKIHNTQLIPVYEPNDPPKDIAGVVKGYHCRKCYVEGGVIKTHDTAGNQREI